jgi:hypothetical protein
VGTNEEAVRQATALYWWYKGLNADDVKAIACLISSGSLGSLTILILAYNQISDDGMKAFSTALSSGALNSLTTLYLNNNPASNSAKNTMRAVASNRSIYLSI